MHRWGRSFLVHSCRLCQEFQHGNQKMLDVLHILQGLAFLKGHVNRVCLTVQEYYGVSGSVDLADMEPDFSSSESVAAVQGMPLLQLSPDDRAVNICLLATLPAYRRQGVATLLLEQATSSARAIRYC